MITCAINTDEVSCSPTNWNPSQSVAEDRYERCSSKASINESPLFEESLVSATCTLVSSVESKLDDDLNPNVFCASDDEAEVYSNTRKRVSYINNEFNINIWDDCPEENVLSVPFDVNGLRKFRIQCERQNMMNATKDGRPWTRWHSSSRKFFSGVRRIARCKGSHMCPAECCPFVKLQKGPNKVQFRSEGGVVVCFSCGNAADAVACSAAKIWEYEQDAVVVMHKGIHSCQPKVKTISRQQLMKIVKENLGVKPSKLVNEEMMKVMTADNFSWEHLEKMAESFTDLKRIHNVRAAARNLANPLGNNFEALAVFKKKCDEKDRYLIFKVNNRDLNGEPSYVFKSSKAMVELAISLDKDRDGPMRFEYAFVDAKHDRCRGFKTVTLWAYNDVMRKLVCLAIMEAEQENTENLIRFWQLLNEMLQDFTQMNGYKFNPYGFVADENHANWNSIRKVFGEKSLERVVSCEFHYKQSVQRQANKLGVDSTKFKLVANDMLLAPTVQQFKLACSEMQSILTNNSQLQGWYRWWYDRRTHIFAAFKVAGAPASNLAEVGHSKLQSVGRCYMSILESAREDVACALRQEAQMKVFTSGLPVGGRGRNYTQRKAMEYKAGMKRAAAYAAELDDVEISASRDSVFVPKTGSHRPPEKHSTKRPFQRSFQSKSRETMAGPSMLMHRHNNIAFDTGKPDRKRLTIAPKPCVAVAGRTKKVKNVLSEMRNAKTNVTHHATKDSREIAPKVITKCTENGSMHFTVVQLTLLPTVQVCYDCQLKFARKHRSQPNDLILRSYCRRRYQDKTGVYKISSKTTAIYCHLKMACVHKIQPSTQVRMK